MTAKSSNILLVTWNFPPKRGGMERLLYDLYVCLGKHYTVEVIAPHARGEPHVNSGVHRAPLPGFFSFTLYALFKALQLIFKKRVHLFFGGSLAVAPVLALLRRLFRTPVAVYTHGLDVIYKNALYQRLLRWSVPCLDGVICNSRNTRKLLECRFFVKGASEVIPPGIHVDNFQQSCERPFAEPYLLSVGRLTERKGLVTFIQNSFDRILAQHPELHLVIVGSEPKEAVAHSAGYCEKLQNVISEKGLTENVHLMGEVDNGRLCALYQHCEAFVLPLVPVSNDVEGFGIVAAEAAASGTPTIAFDEGGVKDAVLPNRTGIIVDQSDYDGFATAVCEILEGKKRFPDIVAEARKTFDWEQLCSRYITFIRNRILS